MLPSQVLQNLIPFLEIILKSPPMVLDKECIKIICWGEIDLNND